MNKQNDFLAGFSPALNLSELPKTKIRFEYPILGGSIKKTIVFHSPGALKRRPFQHLLSSVFVKPKLIPVESLPRVETVEKTAEEVPGQLNEVNTQDFDGEIVWVAYGGGSVMDFSKAILAKLIDLKVFPRERVYSIAFPTTAGTGSEVTSTATVWDFKKFTKHSVSGGQLVFDEAILLADHTLSLPRNVTLVTALDALSHASESLWNKNATETSRRLSIAAIRKIRNALRKVLEEPKDLDARKEMLQASTLAGLAISITKTAIAHSISYPLTLHHQVPHGIACSVTLPEVAAFNLVDNTQVQEDLKAAFESVNPVSAMKEFFEDVGANDLFREIFSRLKVSPSSLKGELLSPSRAGLNTRRVNEADAIQILESALLELGVQQRQNQ